MTRADRTLTNRGESKRAATAPVPQLVRVLGYERPAVAGSRHEAGDVDEVVIGRGDRDASTRDGRTLVLAVADPRMSKRHARLERIVGGWAVEDLASRNGTFVDGEAIVRAVVEPGATIELGRTAFVLVVQPPGGAPDVGADALAPALGDVRTFSTTFADTLAGAARIAATAQNIVVRGDTGTGKELIARGVHAASKRAGAFVAVNCGALPGTLIESELFGYRKGAFSGATEDRVGLVRTADGGTLFLDEIADLPLVTQAALLRVLQEREVLPVGATRPIAIDLRVVAATHRDLARAVAAGTFRDDLFARLSGYTLEVPPLCARREDLGLLIASVLGRFGPAGAAARLSPEAGAALMRYDWPHNVRELVQLLGSALALAAGGDIELAHLPPALRGGARRGVPDDELSPAEKRRSDEIRALLARHGGNIAAVGRELGVARMQVHRWLERYGIDVAAFRRK